MNVINLFGTYGRQAIYKTRENLLEYKFDPFSPIVFFPIFVSPKYYERRMIRFFPTVSTTVPLGRIYY